MNDKRNKRKIVDFPFRLFNSFRLFRHLFRLSQYIFASFGRHGRRFAR